MNEEISKNLTKTGTVTIGIVCKGAIVVAADRRTSYGGQGGVSYLAGDVKKIIEVNKKTIATMAGTASDAVKLLQVLRAEIRLKELKIKEEMSIDEIATLLSNMAYQSIRTPSMIPAIAHFIVAGFDSNGIHLYDVSPDGLLKKEEGYVASGSGIMQAHPILDSDYKKDMSVEEGIKLATKCIRASMGRDPSVGEGMDVYVVKPGEIKQVVSHISDIQFKEDKR